MAYHTRPIYIPIDAAAVAALVNGTGSTLTEAKVGSGTLLSAMTTPAPNGGITHIGFKMSSSGGTATVNVWQDTGRTVPLASVVLTPATIPGGSAIVWDEVALSGPDGAPFRGTFYYEVVGDATSATKTGTIYFKVKATT